MNLDSVTFLHLEITSRCNASCPACSRNNFGYGLRPGFVEQDLDLDRLREVLEMLPNLRDLSYCGSEGDCISSKNFLDSLDIVLERDIKKLLIHTNGSLKTEDWWSRLADRLKGVDHEVWFGIDGLEDTHNIYRQNTDYKKIIANATAFIRSGGRAMWQFIPFKHNQHQIKDAYRLSRQLGFFKFILVKNSRYPDKAFHHLTGKPIEILPWDYQEKFDRHGGDSFIAHQSENDTVSRESCVHLRRPGLYLSCRGELTPCCYIPTGDIGDYDIERDFQTGNFRKECLHWCGSKSCKS